MGGLLGQVGGLEELVCASEVQVGPVTDSVLSIRTALDGTEYVQLRASRPPRQWQVSVSTATPGQARDLYQLEALARTNRMAFVYYPEDSQVENMLDPESSLMSRRRWTNVMPGGARVPLDDLLPGQRFLASASTRPDGTWAHLSNIPVPRDRTVTCSVRLVPYQGQTAYFHVDELRMDGSTLRVHEASTDGVLHRLVHTFQTSHETVALTFGVSRAAGVAHPCLTLTDAPAAEWAVGAGCMSAVLMAPPTKTVQLAIPNLSWGSRSAHAWTIREIGRGTPGH